MMRGCARLHPRRPQRRLCLGADLRGPRRHPRRAEGRPAGRPRCRPARRRPAGAAAACRAHRGRPSASRPAGDPDRRRPDALGHGAARSAARRSGSAPPAAGRPRTPRSSPGRSISPPWSGAGDSVLEIADGTRAILDGNSGPLVLEPSEADEAQARRALADHQRAARGGATGLLQAGHHDRRHPHRGRGQHRRRRPRRRRRWRPAAKASGLLRTEFLFLRRDRPPARTSSSRPTRP